MVKKKSKKEVVVPGKRAPEVVRKEFQGLVKDERKAFENSSQISLKLALRAYEIQYHQHWRHYLSKNTDKAFATFGEWLREDAGESRTRVFAKLGIVKYLPLSAEKMEELGLTKCEEVAKVAKHAPRRLAKLIEQVQEHPEMTAKDVKQLVSRTLDGHTPEPQKYKYFELAMTEAEAAEFYMALQIMQAQDPLNDPENQVSMGRHVHNICVDWMTTAEAQETREKLEKSGQILLPPEIDDKD